MAQSAAILKSSLAVGSSGVSDIVEDTSPQLGGNLDVNGNSIVSTSNGDINISPNGTGTVVINTDLDVDNLNLNANQITATDTNGDIWIQQDGTGSIYLDNVQVQSASIQSRFTNGSFNVNSKGTGSIFLDDLKIKDATIESNQTDQDITITPYGSGSVVIDGLSYPQSDGTAGQVLQTDGEGNLSFVDQSGGQSDAVAVTESPATDPIQIDLDNGTVFTLDKNTYTNSSITISNGSEGITYQLVVTSDGNSYTFGNTNLYWPNNSAPTPSAVNKKDIYSIIKIGSNYYGSYAFNYN